MRTKAIFAATLLAWVPLPIVAQDFDAGIRTAEDGDYATAMLEWMPLAEDGYAEAQHMVGLVYRTGAGGVQKSNEMALHWVSRAAKQGNVFSQTYLGHMYFLGQGTPQDFVTAHMWHNIALSGDWVSPRHDADQIATMRHSTIMSLNRIQVSLPPDAVIEAQRRARVCMASSYQDCE